MDWWNLKAEHTPFEWAVQWAMYLACPYGERRADMRAAHNTVNSILSQAANPEKLTAEDIRAMTDAVSQYLKCDQPQDDEETADLAALALMKGGA